MDVQGHEWECIVSGQAVLARVQNLFVEAQDIDVSNGGLMMYNGAMSPGALDSRLGALDFVRQYCELNSFGFKGADLLREVNCLYTRLGQLPIWVTGRPQKGAVVQRNLSARPRFHTTYIPKLRTSPTVGALDERLRALGARFMPTEYG